MYSIISNSFLFTKFSYGLYDIYNGSLSHLTLWTWNLHCLAEYYQLYSKNVFLKNKLSTMSFVGSYCILNSYLYVLFLNPNLENDLNKNKNKKYIWIRSLILHLLPCISTLKYLVQNKIKSPLISYYQYLIIPLAHLSTGIIYKKYTEKDTFNAYRIYLNYNNKSNIKKITEPFFIISNLGIMISTIHLCKYVIDKY